MNVKEYIEQGKASLGIEFGSTRIKAVLIGEDNQPVAIGAYDWENRLEGGIWTYPMEEAMKGLRGCYGSLKKDAYEKYGVTIKKLSCIGISGMMHGYLPLDKNDELLVPFRTWRNTITEKAADELTQLLDFNIPQRWSIAHLYQAVLNGESHVNDIAHLTTLAGYIHFRLTGEKVVGIGEASGIFPIDSDAKDYDGVMMEKTDAALKDKGITLCLKDVLPKILLAGESAGRLTEEGAALLDESGDLEPGAVFCPPEGDAQTGMVATNSITVRTGNVSAGTSIFAMVVLEKKLSKVYRELDIVTTPTGNQTAMVHCNNCTSDINAWIGLFREFADTCGFKIDQGKLFETMYSAALKGEDDCGGLMAFNYYSGEPITGFDDGRLLFIRKPDARLNLANFMRTNLYSSLATLKIGMDILIDREKVRVDMLQGHGGFFKTEGVGDSLLAAALRTPVKIIETAGEGGAWGMAVLASYCVNKEPGETLDSFLEDKVFAQYTGKVCPVDEKAAEGFDRFMEGYVKCFGVEKAAIENF
ncbi:MAG: FGGY-family carbohydrate kinase [Christensenellaceae bacterium]|nr:FGGY-family carbohydrate kinase [Christensenellaceae bacterium]